MTHYLLNYLDVRFIFAKSCEKRMAKSAATEMRDDNGLHHLVIMSVALLIAVTSIRTPE